VAELFFQLHGSPIHPEFFDILASRKIQREDFELTVRITAAPAMPSPGNGSAKF